MEPIIISYCYCSFLSTLVGQGVQKYNRPQSLLIATCYWLLQADIILHMPPAVPASIEATTCRWLIISCMNLFEQNTQRNLYNKFIGQSIYTNCTLLISIRYQCLLNCFKVSESNNSDVRGSLWSSWPLHNFLKWHVFRSIPPLTHHEFGKW